MARIELILQDLSCCTSALCDSDARLETLSDPVAHGEVERRSAAIDLSVPLRRPSPAHTQADVRVVRHVASAGGPEPGPRLGRARAPAELGRDARGQTRTFKPRASETWGNAPQPSLLLPLQSR